MTKQISVQQGLNELKLYDSRITKEIGNIEAYFNVTSDGKVNNNQQKTAEEFSKQQRSQIQKVVDLIKNRDKLKSAVVMSNALTKVKIAGVEYTVAEAIEKKSSISNSKFLVNQLTTLYAKAENNAANFNDRIDAQTRENVQSLLGSDKDKNDLSELIKSIEKIGEDKKIRVYDYKILNGVSVIDYISELNQEIEDFLTEVDYVLTESNVITKIEVDV